MKSCEDLIIYKEYMILLQYTEHIVIKYPKIERNVMVEDIRKRTYEGMAYIIYASKEMDRNKRIKILNRLDGNLKILKVLIRISYKKKYINSKNYYAWSKKITNIGMLTGGWIRACVKQ